MLNEDFEPISLVRYLLMTQKFKYLDLRYIEYISDRNGLYDHFLPIFIVQNLLRPPVLGLEVRDDVIFNQSGNDCPVIPHSSIKVTLIRPFLNQQN